jgi:hypothetical protein
MLAAILTCAVVIVFHTTVGTAKLDDDDDALSDYALKMAMAAQRTGLPKSPQPTPVAPACARKFVTNVQRSPMIECRNRTTGVGAGWFPLDDATKRHVAHVGAAIGYASNGARLRIGLQITRHTAIGSWRI